MPKLAAPESIATKAITEAAAGFKEVEVSSTP
jgi:hypothetical protein